MNQESVISQVKMDLCHPTGWSVGTDALPIGVQVTFKVGNKIMLFKIEPELGRGVTTFSDLPSGLRHHPIRYTFRMMVVETGKDEVIIVPIDKFELEASISPFDMRAYVNTRFCFLDMLYERELERGSIRREFGIAPECLDAARQYLNNHEGEISELLEEAYANYGRNRTKDVYYHCVEKITSGIVSIHQFIEPKLGFSGVSIRRYNRQVYVEIYRKTKIMEDFKIVHELRKFDNSTDSALLGDIAEYFKKNYPKCDKLITCIDNATKVLLETYYSRL